MSLLISIIAAALWIRVLNSLDKGRKLKSNKSFIKSFIFAGFVSIPLVFIISGLIEPVLRPFYTASVIIDNICMVGMVEEVSKFIPFFFLTLGKKAVKEPRDGIIHAASVGLAFALVENLMYSGLFGMEVLLIRSLLTTVGHMTLSSIWGCAAGVYIYNSNTREAVDYSPLTVVGAIIAAGVFHGLYNSLLDYGHFIPALLVDSVILGITINMLRLSTKASPYRNMSIRDYKTAIPALEKALKKNPRNFYLNKQLGFCYICSGDWMRGKKYLKVANILNSKEISVRFFLNFLDYSQSGDLGAERTLNYLSKSLSGRSKSVLRRKIVEVIWSQPERKEALKIIGKY